jgi:hypothetical protein
MTRIQGGRAFLLVVALIIIQGCTSTKSSVKPVGEISEANRSILCGVVVYDGHNRDYLPLSLRNTPDRKKVLIQYQYEVKYGVEDDTAFDLFNPLLLFGVPKSEDSVVVLGKLEIKNDSGFEKTYEEVIVLRKYKNIFSEGETLTDIRRKGLIQMRNKIDSAIAEDRGLFSSHGLLCTMEE